MSDKHQELFDKYMEIHSQLINDYEPLQMAAVLTVQALSIYKTMLPEAEYLAMVESIYESRHDIKQFTGPILQ